MNSKAYFLIGLSIVLSLLCEPGLAQNTSEAGTAGCLRDHRERDETLSGCRIKWDFTRFERSVYWIERFERRGSEGEWQPWSGPFRDHTGESDDNLPGGHLYRVVGCDDQHAQSNCLSSTVMWAPLVEVNLDEIPEEIETASGSITSRSPNMPREFQIVQYNMALVMQLFSSLDVATMPPMSELAFRYPTDIPIGVALWDATLDFNVWDTYMMRRDPSER